MFLDPDHRYTPRPAPPEPAAPKLTKRQETALAWVAAGALLLSFLSPIAGGTVVQAVVALAGR